MLSEVDDAQHGIQHEGERPRGVGLHRPVREVAHVCVLRHVREIILRADRRLTEYVKHRTVQFAYEGDFASFVHYTKPQVTLMLNRGAKIPGKFPHVEGSGPTARFMRFKDLAEVEARADELGRVARAWCDLMATAPKKGSQKR